MSQISLLTRISFGLVIAAAMVLLALSQTPGTVHGATLNVDGANPACSDVSGNPHCTIGSAVADSARAFRRNDGEASIPFASSGEWAMEGFRNHALESSMEWRPPVDRSDGEPSRLRDYRRGLPRNGAPYGPLWWWEYRRVDILGSGQYLAQSPRSNEGRGGL